MLYVRSAPYACGTGAASTRDLPLVAAMLGLIMPSRFGPPQWGRGGYRLPDSVQNATKALSSEQTLSADQADRIAASGGVTDVKTTLAMTTAEAKEVFTATGKLALELPSGRRGQLTWLTQPKIG